MPRLAMILRWPLSDVRARVSLHLLRATRWIISSNVRTWSLLAPFLTWSVMEAAGSNPWEAAVLLITVPPVFGAGVEALRRRLRTSNERPPRSP